MKTPVFIDIENQPIPSQSTAEEVLQAICNYIYSITREPGTIYIVGSSENIH